MFNPWIILAVVIAFGATNLASHIDGERSGIAKQKVADQAAIDAVNAKIDHNKLIAQNELNAAKDNLIALGKERDNFKTQLYQEHQSNAQITDQLHAALDPVRLRFGADPARGGGCSTNAVSGEGNPSSNAGPAQVCVVSEAVDRNLKSLAYDADKMRDDFILCYDYVNRSK